MLCVIFILCYLIHFIINKIKFKETGIMSKKTKLVLSGVVLGAVASICAVVYFVNKGKESMSDFEDDFEDEEEIKVG